MQATTETETSNSFKVAFKVAKLLPQTAKSPIMTATYQRRQSRKNLRIKKVIISERDREIAAKPSIYPSLMPEMVKESKSSFIHS